MAEDRKPVVSHDEIEINLKDPVLAGFWAWLWPGAGHIYQGRYAKGALFMICILGTYFYGLALSGGHVVYFSWTETDRRLPYICQVGVGLPALPALVQSYQVIVKDKKHDYMWGGFMAPPHPVLPGGMDTKAKWCARYGFRWDMAELYTMVAGLLNILAIFDAAAGPVLPLWKKKKRTKTNRRPRSRKIRKSRRPAESESESLMDGILFANILASRIWYAVPLIVAVSLVYAATRHELMVPILRHALHTAVWIVGFMAVVGMVLLLLTFLAA